MKTARVLFRIAVRNLVRERRRSGLVALAMALAVAVLMFFLALGDAMHAQWIDAGVRLADGYVAIERPAWTASGDLADRLTAADLAAARAAIGTVSGTSASRNTRDAIRNAVTRLTVSALASSAASALPVRVTGVEPDRERGVSLLPDKLVAGRFLSDSDRLAAVVGRGFADRLSLAIGSRFVLAAQGAGGGEVAEQLVRVVGVFRTGIREVDDGVVDIPISTARSWLAAPGAATSLTIMLGDDRATDRVVAGLNAALPPDVRALSWRRTAPALDAAVRVDNFGSYLFNAVLLAIVTLAVLEALLVSVLHRSREFGVLQALGLTSRATSAIVLAEGVCLAGASGVVGLALGGGITWWLGRTGLDLSAVLSESLSISGAVVSPIVHPTVEWARAWQGVVVVFVLGILSALYPMWRATRVDVATAMHSDQ